jgi:hypothetical protein
MILPPRSGSEVLVGGFLRIRRVGCELQDFWTSRPQQVVKPPYV